MHIKENSSWIKHLDFITLNIISVILAFVIAYYIKFDNLGFVNRTEWRAILVVMCLINFALTFIINPFSGILHRPYYEDALKMGIFTVDSFVVVGVLFYVMKVGALFSRIQIILTFIFYYFIVVALACTRKKLLLSGVVKGVTDRKRKLFLVTAFKDIEETKENVLSGDVEDYLIVGYCFTDGLYDAKEYDGCEVVDVEWVADHVITEHVDDVFIFADPTIFSTNSYRKLVDNGVTVHLGFESTTGTEGDDQFISNIGVYKTACIGPYAFDERYLFYLVLKRICDVVFGLIGCVLLIPFIIIIKITYVLSGDTASIFYYQTRVGLYGKPFKLYKFRSMVPNADEVLAELLKQEDYRKQWETNQKFDDDPRITKLGKHLRKASLDELPQFINIVKGDMSLVGPRPLIPGELTQHDGRTLYNRVKPGITGWWACNGRSNIKYRERLELEYYYVKNCSLYLDLLCILRTIILVLRREGAQ